jgi:hypothetical protein
MAHNLQPRGIPKLPSSCYVPTHAVAASFLWCNLKAISGEPGCHNSRIVELRRETVFPNGAHSSPSDGGCRYWKWTVAVLYSGAGSSTSHVCLRSASGFDLHSARHAGFTAEVLRKIGCFWRCPFLSHPLWLCEVTEYLRTTGWYLSPAEVSLSAQNRIQIVAYAVKNRYVDT